MSRHRPLARNARSSVRPAPLARRAAGAAAVVALLSLGGCDLGTYQADVGSADGGTDAQARRSPDLAPPRDGALPLVDGAPSVDAASAPDAAARPPMAPNGYYVVGNAIFDASGHPHLFHGVDRPSLEFSATGYNLSANDYQLMASWKARVVRLALSQDYWLKGSTNYAAGYAATVDQQIAWAHAASLDVILDLHWSDRGDLGNASPGQQLMADENSIPFWREVATRYRGDGRVLFELYNEPHDIPWAIWQSGGMTSEGWTAVGMQQLYDAVRATGAENLVLVGGNQWSSDLSGVPAHRVVGHNIVYVTHPYDWPGEQPSDWMNLFGFLTATDPVIATEFGDTPRTMPACGTSYYQDLIAFADAHNMSWTSWAWWPGDCVYPAIISDWNGTPNPMGAVVKAALLGYP